MHHRSARPEGGRRTARGVRHREKESSLISKKVTAFGSEKGGSNELNSKSSAPVEAAALYLRAAVFFFWNRVLRSILRWPEQ
jgi:hypothetical protein